MAPSNAAPLEIRREKSDEWLNVAGNRGFESGLYLIRIRHRASLPIPKIPERARGGLVARPRRVTGRRSSPKQRRSMSERVRGHNLERTSSARLRRPARSERTGDAR